MKTKTLMQLTGLIILVFVILFGSKDIFEYKIAKKYVEICSTSNQKDSICASASQHQGLSSQSNNDLSSLIIDVLNSSINLTIVLISIFLAVFIFILGFLMNSMEKTLTTNINSIEKLKIQIQEKEEQIQIKIDKLDMVEKIFKEKIALISNVEAKLDIQNRYIEKSSNYIYNSLDQEAEKRKDKKLKNRLIIEKQILALYSTQKTDRIAGLHFFGENGIKDHMEDIRYVSENDLDEGIRKQALKVLGRIEERENPQNDTMNS